MNLFSALGALPKIQTRKALILLDFQNDFVRDTGALYVPNTQDFLDSLSQLTNVFRRTGDVVWVRSYYESRRQLIGPDGQSLVVLNRTEEDTRSKQLPHDEPEGPIHEEAFLSTESPRCCLPHSAGVQFPAPVLAAINAGSDTLIEKSEYSALQSSGLVLSLRTRFVTELYLCGSLSNTSVHATVLDAVRHGFSVTLIEDCLGYRNFSRHEEAMRCMADIYGANGITSQELLEELDWQETDCIARKGEPRPARPIAPAGIEGVMEELEVKPDLRASPERDSPKVSSAGARRRRIADLLAELPDDEGHLLELTNLTRTRNMSRYAPPPGDAQTSELGDKLVRTKVRRTKRPDTRGEPSSSRGEHRRSRKPKQAQDICRPGDVIGEGDSRIVYDLDLPENAFERIRDEVAWQKMYHMSGQVPRLVAVQGKPSPDGSIPIYRHPADESPPLQPFTQTVDQVRLIVERILDHPLNHVLVQLYRDGQDRISDHSDKTLDIVRGSSICNVSLGAQRVMILRAKGSENEEGSGRVTQRVPMPHESLFVLGEKTNTRWLHGIKSDKRQGSEKSVEERAYDGQRISLTFRHIGTFLDPAGDTIWGQGAVSKLQEKANPVIHGNPEATERLIRAFGEENRAIEFDWNAVYGGGFDVVNFVTPSTAKLALGQDEMANLRVQLCLSENGIRYDLTPLGAVHSKIEGNAFPLYIDSDGTEVAGDIKIMTYLAKRAPETVRPGLDVLQGGDRLSDIDDLLAKWRERQKSHGEISDELGPWEEDLHGQHYLGGTMFGIDDCSLWPVLREIVLDNGPFSEKDYPNLSQYYNRVAKRGMVKAVLEEMK
ncbi:hypothetical protein P175DRAFT_0435033 [Aspergillus ochraceoroseus IBT 24754]|uniref:Isochorismatase family protein family n=3 Tax=Aspergillus subgen. Nidulantes TaxID=2720870 RepID=A0A0F8WT41_9EURO|nr:uncharacterized protein P175DRAFT_0435033 [Aspergillus ochraceoroseus IBT 24754]KKK14417.1 hypothetical protein ARAM_000079 [Aspergillus rambellii]KKK25791.1 hypothetical protein AOCH_006905 [Aspergillus ochraceoroseus]PTU21558.1 hypothetical protein P175DRAFT_0435033 [Aspergillus ochraceoroseus IBT 24754]